MRVQTMDIINCYLCRLCVMSGVLFSAAYMHDMYTPQINAQTTEAAPQSVQTQVSINAWHDQPSEFVIRLNQHLPPHERLAWYINPQTNDAQWPGHTLRLENVTVEQAIQAYCEKANLTYVLTRRLLWIGTEDERKEMEQKTIEALINLSSEKTEEINAAEEKILAMWGVNKSMGQKTLFFTFLGHPDPRKMRYTPVAEYGGNLPAPWVMLQMLNTDIAIRQSIEHYIGTRENLSQDPLGMLIASLIPMPQMISAAGEWNSKQAARARVKGRWQEWERNSMFRRYMPNWIQRIEAKNKLVSENEYAEIVKQTTENIEKMNPGKNMADRQLRSLLRMMQEGYGRQWGADSERTLIKMATQGAHPSMRVLALAILGLRQGDEVQATIVDRLNNDDEPSVRRAAASALGQLRTESAIEILKTELFENESPIMRRNAAIALARSRHPEASTWLLQALQNADGAEAQAIIQVLGLTRQDSARNALIKIVLDEKEDLGQRQSAALALTADRSDASIQALIEVLKSDAPRVLRERTIKGLQPRNMQELKHNLPIMLSVLKTENDSDLKIELLVGLHIIARALPTGDPRKAEISEQVLPFALDKNLTNNLRIKALETFKYTENPQSVIDALAAQLEKETERVMKSFVRIAAQQAAARPVRQP